MAPVPPTSPIPNHGGVETVQNDRAERIRMLRNPPRSGSDVFGKLPAEVRIMIWEDVVLAEGDEAIRPGPPVEGGHFLPPGLAAKMNVVLHLTCKFVREDLIKRPVFHEVNCFRFADAGRMMAYMSALDHRRRQAVRSIVIINAPVRSINCPFETNGRSSLSMRDLSKMIMLVPLGLRELKLRFNCDISGCHLLAHSSRHLSNDLKNVATHLPNLECLEIEAERFDGRGNDLMRVSTKTRELEISWVSCTKESGSDQDEDDADAPGPEGSFFGNWSTWQKPTECQVYKHFHPLLKSMLKSKPAPEPLTSLRGRGDMFHWAYLNVLLKTELGTMDSCIAAIRLTVSRLSLRPQLLDSDLLVKYEIRDGSLACSARTAKGEELFSCEDEEVVLSQQNIGYGSSESFGWFL